MQNGPLRTVVVYVTYLRFMVRFFEVFSGMGILTKYELELKV